MWKLFLDDYRNPLVASDWKIARNYDEAVGLCNALGCPSHVAFDHDLAEEHYSGDFSRAPSGFTFARWMIEKDIDTGGKFFPDDFSFSVHSMNPSGAASIRSLMTSYLEHRKTRFKKD